LWPRGAKGYEWRVFTDRSGKKIFVLMRVVEEKEGD